MSHLMEHGSMSDRIFDRSFDITPTSNHMLNDRIFNDTYQKKRKDGYNDHNTRLMDRNILKVPDNTISNRLKDQSFQTATRFKSNDDQYQRMADRNRLDHPQNNLLNDRQFDVSVDDAYSYISTENNYSNYGLENASNSLPTHARFNQEEEVNAIFNNSFVDAVNRFGATLGKLLPESSIVFSPYLITIVMCMFYLGSDNNTKKQVMDVFKLPPNMKNLYKEMSEVIAEVGKSRYIHHANGIFINKNIPLNPNFYNHTKQFGDVIMSDLDNMSKEIGKINQWISYMTYNSIFNILEPEDVENGSKSVIASGIVIQPDWKYPFTAIGHQPFYSLKGKRSVPMMTTIGRFSCYQNKTSRIIEMPTKNDDIVMGIVLPLEKNSSPRISNSGLVASYLENFKVRNIELFLPIFTQDNRLQLHNALKNLGVADMFHKFKADLNITSKMDPNSKLHISKFIHESILAVNEGSALKKSDNTLLPTNPPIRMTVDHPFFYYIRHTVTNTLILVGTYH